METAQGGLKRKEKAQMKRTILSKIALVLGVASIGLAGIGQAKAEVAPSAFEVITSCDSNGVRVAGVHGLYESPVSGNPARVYYATYLMKAFPPNWVYTGRMNSWSLAPHKTALNTPVAMPILDIIGSQRFAISEPGTYFVWVLFAYPNGSGYSYHWQYSSVCTIKGSVFAGPGAAKAGKVKKAKRAVKMAPRPTKPPAGLG
jgi:hypothetical protein